MASIVRDKLPTFDVTQLITAFREFLQKMRGECPVFRVLVVGETGTGKSTLINNLIGKEVAQVGHSYESETATIAELEVEVEGVPIVLFDTPGLGDSRGDHDDKYLQDMEDILKKRNIHLVIYCLKLSETRMRESLIRTFKEYSRIGVNWERTVIALTFADLLPVSAQVKKTPGFDMRHYFNSQVAEWHARITSMLVERVEVSLETARGIRCYPTTSDSEEKLLNGEGWYVPLWLDILELLSPGAAMRFLELHTNNIESSGPEVHDPSFLHNPGTIASRQSDAITHDAKKPRVTVRLQPAESKRLWEIIAEKVKSNAKAGAAIGALTGATVGILGGLVGIVVGVGVGAAVGTPIGGYVGLIRALFTKTQK